MGRLGRHAKVGRSHGTCEHGLLSIPFGGTPAPTAVAASLTGSIGRPLALIILGGRCVLRSVCWVFVRLAAVSSAQLVRLASCSPSVELAADPRANCGRCALLPMYKQTRRAAFQKEIFDMLSQSMVLPLLTSSLMGPYRTAYFISTFTHTVLVHDAVVEKAAHSLRVWINCLNTSCLSQVLIARPIVINNPDFIIARTPSPLNDVKGRPQASEIIMRP